MVSSQGENTPLLGNNENQNYYFLNGNGRKFSDAGEYVEDLPPGASAEEFAPRVLDATTVNPPAPAIPGPPLQQEEQGLFSKLFSKLFGFISKSDAIKKVSPLKPRTAPIKIEPKVFFANERTFLAWMHVSIILAGASIAILAFSGKKSNPGSQVYGMIMLPVAVCFIVYAMFQYTRRAYMLRNKLPGPYDDTAGPTILGIILMISIVSQFAIKLYTIAA